MFRAIGIIFLFMYLSHIFSASFEAFDKAATATFQTVELAAQVSKEQLEAQSK